MLLPYYSADGAAQGERDYPIPALEGDRGVMALRQMIIALQANARQGTRATKTRSHVHGTGKKPFKQKGLGIARQGSKVGPQHRHGAKVHGPQPQDFRQKVNLKVRKLAFQRALFDRALDKEIAVIEKFALAAPKTKLFDAVVAQVAPEGRILVVDAGWSEDNLRAARNIARLDVTEAARLNVVELADYTRIIVSEQGLAQVLARAGETAAPAAEAAQGS